MSGHNTINYKKNQLSTNREKDEFIQLINQLNKTYLFKIVEANKVGLITLLLSATLLALGR